MTRRTRILIAGGVLLVGGAFVALSMRRSAPSLAVSFRDFYTNNEGVLAMLRISNRGPDMVSFDLITKLEPPVVSHEGLLHPHATRVHAVAVPRRPCQIDVMCRERYSNTNNTRGRVMKYLDNLWKIHYMEADQSWQMLSTRLRHLMDGMIQMELRELNIPLQEVIM